MRRGGLRTRRAVQPQAGHGLLPGNARDRAGDAGGGLQAAHRGEFRPRLPAKAGHGLFVDKIAHPLVRNVIGRTVYADMRAMEEYLRTVPDVDWTVIRPGKLADEDAKRPYLKEPEEPSRLYTTRRDRAKAILDHLDSGADVHQAVAVTSR